MFGKDRQPTEPLPETDPYGYLDSLIGSKKGRIIKTSDFNVGLLRLKARRGPKIIQIHVFTYPKEYFALSSRQNIIAAVTGSPSVTGVGLDELLSNENAVIDNAASLKTKKGIEAFLNRAEQAMNLNTTPGQSNSGKNDSELCVRLARFVQDCIKHPA